MTDEVCKVEKDTYILFIVRVMNYFVYFLMDAIYISKDVQF